MTGLCWRACQQTYQYIRSANGTRILHSSLIKVCNFFKFVGFPTGNWRLESCGLSNGRQGIASEAPVVRRLTERRYS